MSWLTLAGSVWDSNQDPPERLGKVWVWEDIEEEGLDRNNDNFDRRDTNHRGLEFNKTKNKGRRTRRGRGTTEKQTQQWWQEDCRKSFGISKEKQPISGGDPRRREEGQTNKTSVRENKPP